MITLSAVCYTLHSDISSLLLIFLIWNCLHLCYEDPIFNYCFYCQSNESGCHHYVKAWLGSWACIYTPVKVSPKGAGSGLAASDILWTSAVCRDIIVSSLSGRFLTVTLCIGTPRGTTTPRWLEVTVTSLPLLALCHQTVTSLLKRCQ